MPKLSPAAQKIVDAHDNATDKYAALAAFVRAVAEEAVPDCYADNSDDAALIKQELLAIADELEAQ